MKKNFFAFMLMLFALTAVSQKTKSKSSSSVSEIRVQLSSAQWQFPAGAAEFLTYKEKPAMKILTAGDKIILKDFVFTDGTIEFDIEHQEGFCGIYFRMADNNETENFYLRGGRVGNPVAMDAVQYAAYNKGVNLWDLLDHYQGPANIKKNEWNHIKLVVSGKQMLVYVNDLSRATLEIPRLEGNTESGSIAFNGKSIIANLIIKPNVTEGLPGREGFDPTHHDPRYIRLWQVSEPQALTKGNELYDGMLPKPSVTWKNITAERRGLINLTRIYGGSESRRFIWLRVRLITTTELKRKISLGFSDEVWVFLNRQPVFVDKNIYTSAGMRKNPDGRISIENSNFDITLKAGQNDLLIGVANDFYGWGIMARLDNLEGIEINTNFPEPLIQPKDLSKYLGIYSSPEMPEKITISDGGETLMGQATGQQAVPFEYFEKDKFRFDQAGVVLEFYPDEKKMLLKQGGKTLTFTKP